MRRYLGLLSVLYLMGCEGSALLGASTPGHQAPSSALPDAPLPTAYVAPSGDSNAQDACEGVVVAAAPSPLRRLEPDAQTRTFRDILGSPSLTPALAPWAGPVVTELEVERLNVAAKTMVEQGGHLTYLPQGCNPSGAFDLGCADDFIRRLGRMAFRRPLTEAEQTWLRTDVFDALRTHPNLSPPATFREALDAVAQAVLQAPQVLYVHEDGVVDAALPANVRRLTGHERATRLSYLVWGTTPDEALLTAADQGELDTAQGVRAQAERLLQSPRAHGNVRDFVARWLSLDGNSHQASLEQAPKSASLFPFDSPSLRAAMREEVLSLYEDAVFSPGGSFKSLMTSPKAYVNRSLGALYGVSPLPASDNTFQWVDLPGTERAGLFTRAAFLALYAPQEQKSPIRRGVFLYRHALCRQLADPPANVSDTPLPSTNHALTVREQVEARTTPASCQGCHAAINPLGFVLENYDAMGRYHTQETQTYLGQSVELPVDAAATPVNTDFDGPVEGPLALSEKLGQSGLAQDCVATTWFADANPRPLNSTDACSVQRLMRRFRSTGSLRDLLLELATSESNLFIQVTP